MHKDLVIVNAKVLADPAAPALIHSGFVHVRAGRVAAVGPMAAGRPEAAELIDAGGCLVLPGLVNGHCHGAMTLFRGLADDLELMTWLNGHIFPAEARFVDPEMVYWCTRLAAAELLLSGTTTVADGYFHESEAARAFADSGIRAMAAQGVIDFPAPGAPDPAANVAVAAAFLEEWQGRDPLLSPAVFAHSPYTCSAATLRRAKALCRERGARLFIHVAETGAEAGLIRDPAGDSPLRHLDALGLLDRDTVCIHGVHLDEADLDRIAASGAGLVLCPQSNCKLASGLAPLPAMLVRGLRVGLGTDGAASNNGLDLFREMNLCAKVHKLHARDPMAAPASAVLAMATAGGAAALGLEGEIGALRPGMAADLVVLELGRPHLQPFHGPGLLVHAASGGDVRDVLVNGRVVVRDRRLLSMDLGETMAHVRRLAAAVTG